MGDLTLPRWLRLQLDAAVREGAGRFGEPGDSLAGEFAAARIKRAVLQAMPGIDHEVVESAIRARVRIVMGGGTRRSSRTSAPNPRAKVVAFESGRISGRCDHGYVHGSPLCPDCTGSRLCTGCPVFKPPAEFIDEHGDVRTQCATCRAKHARRNARKAVSNA
jgi:hypothetical protein